MSKVKDIPVGSQGSCAVKKSKRVLVACEYSGVVRDAFRRLGHLRSKTFEGFANAMAEQWGQA